ncbi:MAG: hypothetical protein ACTSR8_14380 [Promethearchaeota archaeon]
MRTDYDIAIITSLIITALVFGLDIGDALGIIDLPVIDELVVFKLGVSLCTVSLFAIDEAKDDHQLFIAENMLMDGLFMILQVIFELVAELCTKGAGVQNDDLADTISAYFEIFLSVIDFISTLIEGIDLNGDNYGWYWAISGALLDICDAIVPFKKIKDNKYALIGCAVGVATGVILTVVGFYLYYI